MTFPKTKLKTQLTLINAFSKIVIIIIAVFVLPWIVKKISIQEMDKQLIDKLDRVYELIEQMGIKQFIDIENSPTGFGSYNILKEEYVSIEVSTDTVLNEYIESTQRIIDNEIFDYRVISANFEYDHYYYLLEIGQSTAAITLFEKNLRNFTFIFLVLVLTLSIIFDMTVTQVLLRPFEMIIKNLKKNNHPSNFNYSVTKTTTSDFRYLEDNIHHLMKRIEEIFNEEREYIGNISHEILTPISIIRSKLENFSANTNLEEDDAIKIYETKVTLGRLTKLVRSLLLLSRIENREYLTNENIDINQLVESVLNEIQDRITVKSIRSKTELCSKIYLLKGNKELAHIMIYNLIYNAIRYTPEGGEIQIITSTDNQTFFFEIKDNGIGIPEDKLPYIFDRFKKFQSGNNNFGLGLALVKKICDYHNIKIDVKSKPQKGSTFRLYFPPM